MFWRTLRTSSRSRRMTRPKLSFGADLVSASDTRLRTKELVMRPKSFTPYGRAGRPRRLVRFSPSASARRLIETARRQIVEARAVPVRGVNARASAGNGSGSPTLSRSLRGSSDVETIAQAHVPLIVIQLSTPFNGVTTL